MKPNSFFWAVAALSISLSSHHGFAGEVLNDGLSVVGSPNVTSQVAVADDTTLEVQSDTSIETGTAHAVIDAADGTTVTVINAGTIKTTRDLYDAINTQNSTLVLENSGTIHGLEDAIDTGEATAITNTGTILGGDEGIIAQGHIETLTNSGSITGGRDDGIQAKSIGTIYNSGTIISESDDGILVLGPQGIGSLTNTGRIIADEDAIDTDALNHFKNTGVISARRDAVQVDGDVLTFTNHGSLEAEFGAGAQMWSVQSYINTGTIISHDEGLFLDGEDGSGFGQSVYNSGTIISDGSGIHATNIERLVNTGSISSDAAAIDLDYGTIINSGTLTGSREAAVLFMQETPGAATLINSGTIQNDYSPLNSAIDFRTGGTGELILKPGSVIIGTINLGNTSDVLSVENGLSIANTFIGMPEEINGNGAAVAIAGNQVAVADTSGIAVVNNAFVDLTSSISASVNARLSEFSPKQPVQEKSRGAWVIGFGAGSRWNGTGATTDNTHGYGGFLSGFDGQITPDTRFGAFAGASTGYAQVSYDSQQLDIASFYGGVYGQHQFANHTLNMVLTTGYSEYDSERSVANNTVETGLETASANFGGWFIAPELSMATELSVQDVTILPSAALRYALGLFEDYSESGSAGNLTVDARQLHEFTGRLQLAARAYQTEALQITGFIALEGRLSRGNDRLSGSMLDQSISFTLDDRDEALRGYLGVKASGQISPTTHWFAKAQAATGSDVEFHGQGQLGIVARF